MPVEKQRLSEEQITQINSLVKDGKSLKCITRLLAKPKTTVYYHFRKIKGRTVHPIVPRAVNDELISEFIGLFAGDGCVYKSKGYNYRTYLYFNITERPFVEDLITNVLIKIFGKRPMIFIRENRLILCYGSRNIHEFVDKYLAWDRKSRKTHSVRLKDAGRSRRFKIGFIRGSLDSDGHFSKKQISFASVSRGLIKNIEEFLKDLNFGNSLSVYKEKRLNRKDLYQIRILRKDHKKFIKTIRPRNRVKYGD
jgi:hypothetical protein